MTLFINDYNSEQAGKQQRYHALVERLLARGVPVDGVGHQFHVSLSMPVSALEAALDAFEDTGLTQAVTELDVTTGTPGDPGQPGRAGLLLPRRLPGLPRALATTCSRSPSGA